MTENQKMDKFIKETILEVLKDNKKRYKKEVMEDVYDKVESKNLLSRLFAIRFVSIGWLLKELQKEGLIKGVGNFDCKKCGAGLLGNKKLYTI